MYCGPLETGLDVVTPDTDVVGDFTKLKAHSRPRVSQHRRSTFIYGQGLCCTRTCFLKAIRGLDEFYLGWGSEDRDLVKRLEMLGASLYSIADKTAYLHDSHPKLVGLSDLERSFPQINQEYCQRSATIERNPHAWGCSNLMLVADPAETRGNLVLRAAQPRKFISVIVSVTEPISALRGCLQALVAQTFPRDSYEVIVVDREHRSAVAEIVQEFRAIQYEAHSSVGGTSLRIADIPSALGELLAFTDARSIPQPDWLERGHRYFFGPHAFDSIAGNTAVLPQDPSKPGISERCDELFSACQAKTLSTRTIDATANRFYTRETALHRGTVDSSHESGGSPTCNPLTARSTPLKSAYAADVVVTRPATTRLSALVVREMESLRNQFDARQVEGSSSIAALGQALRNELAAIRHMMKGVRRGSSPTSAWRMGSLACAALAIWAAHCYALAKLSCGLRLPRR